jgi:mRNA interferase YafQ
LRRPNDTREELLMSLAQVSVPLLLAARIKATPRYRDIDGLLTGVLERLVNDEPLPESHRDHSLGGNWKGFRECHVRPDLLLVYRKPPDAAVLQLVRLGSHSELFG